MKKTSKFKKIVAFFMLVTLLFSTSQPIFAASGSGTWAGGQFASFMNTTDHPNTKYGVLIRFLVNTSTGEKRTVFCAEHDIDFATSVVYNGQYYTPTDATIKKACKVAYFGWYAKHGDYVVNGDMSAQLKKEYAYTQQYIWQTLGQSNASFTNSTYQAEYKAYRNEIESKIADMERRPSFDGTTITLQAGESKTLTDSNGVFAKYESVNKTQDGITFIHNKGENTFTISVDENTNIENYNISDNTFKSWGLVKDETQDNDTMIYFEFKDGVQNQIYCMHYNDPVTLRLSLKIELFGKLELQKLDTTGVLVDGAVYNIIGNNYNQDAEVKNGKITIEKLKKGMYSVKEKNAPNGYLLDKNKYDVEIKANQTSSKAIVNTEPTGEIKINKTDISTGNSNRVDNTSHHGDATLKGAVYTLYAKEDIYNVSKSKKYFNANDEIAKFTFDEYGVAKITITSKNVELKAEGEYLTGLPMGKYYSKETQAPTGYKLDTKVYNYELKYKDQNTSKIKENYVVTNDVQRAKFEVIKVSTNNNSTATKIANAEFTAILNKYVEYYGSFDKAKEHLNEFAKDEYSVFKTGENGHGISSELAYGEYMVVETYTPSDEIETVEPFYINIDQNSDGVIKEYIENDLPFESYLKMIKIDKNTGKVVTFSNATFSLYRLNQNNEWEKVKCKTGLFYNDKWKTDKEGLAVTEDKLPSGTYKIEEVKLPTGFLQLEDEIIFKINRSNKTLEFDEDYDAYITVKVGNEQPTGTLNVDKTVEIKEEVDTSLVDISDLSKIQFTLTAKEKILDMADGTTIYEKGANVGTYNLTKDGKLKIKELPMGKYELKEIKTLDGLVLNDQPIEIEFKKKDDTTKVYTEVIKVENVATEIEISKTTITGDKELEGAKLSVIDENGKVIDTWTSTKDTHKIEGLLVGKEYTLREEIAPEGYVLATDIKFTLDNTGNVQKVIMKDKIVSMSKVNVGGEEVEGAKIQVLDKDGKIIDKWTSTKEEHKIKNLKENETYTLHEEVAPDGYVKATDVEFKVTTEKENQHINLIDKVVEVSKEDISGKEIEGAKLQVLDKDNNVIDEWISGKEAHKITGLEEGNKYTLHEEVAIGNYVKATDIEFEVTREKENQKVVMIDKLVEITKTDLTNGAELEGAELEIIDEEGNTIDKWTSTKEPHQVKGLEEGKKYTLRETTAPYGYELTEEIEFEVTTDKETQLVEMKDMPILNDITLIKIDADTKEKILDKFTFGLYVDKECTQLIQQVDSNKDEGTITFEDLRYGTYYVKEISAPKGYQKSDKVVKVEINDKGIFVDDKQIEKDNNEVYSFEFEDHIIETPKTGDEGHIRIWIAVLGISIIALLGVLIFWKNFFKNTL